MGALRLMSGTSSEELDLSKMSQEYDVHSGEGHKMDKHLQDQPEVFADDQDVGFLRLIKIIGG